MAQDSERDQRAQEYLRTRVKGKKQENFRELTRRFLALIPESFHFLLQDKNKKFIFALYLYFLFKKGIYLGSLELRAMSFEFVFLLRNQIFHLGEFQNSILKISSFLVLENQPRNSRLEARSFLRGAK